MRSGPASEALEPDVVIEGLGRCQDGLGDVGDVTGDGWPDLLLRRCAGEDLPDQPDLVEGRAEWPARMTTRAPVPERPPGLPAEVQRPPSAGGYVPVVPSVPAEALAPRPLLVARDLDGDGVDEAIFEFNGRAFAWRGGADIGDRLQAGVPDRALTGIDMAAASISRAWDLLDVDGDGARDLVLGGPPAPVGGGRDLGRVIAAGGQRSALAPRQENGEPGAEEEPAGPPGVAIFSGGPRAAVVDGAAPDAALGRHGLTLWGLGDFDGDGIGDLLVGTPPTAGGPPGVAVELHLGPVGEVVEGVAP